MENAGAPVTVDKVHRAIVPQEKKEGAPTESRNKKKKDKGKGAAVQVKKQRKKKVPNNSTPRYKEGSKALCFRCKKSGHFARECKAGPGAVTGDKKATAKRREEEGSANQGSFQSKTEEPGHSDGRERRGRQIRVDFAIRTGQEYWLSSCSRNLTIPWPLRTF